MASTSLQTRPQTAPGESSLSLRNIKKLAVQPNVNADYQSGVGLPTIDEDVKKTTALPYSDGSESQTMKLSNYNNDSAGSVSDSSKPGGSLGLKR